MTRNTARRIAVRIAFAMQFNDEKTELKVSDYLNQDRFAELSADDEIFSEFPDDKQIEYISAVIETLINNIDGIDSAINKYSRKWTADRLSKTALSILRVAVCEMLYFDNIPTSVSVNEAVEISKEFDSSETTAFINGVLGSIVRNELTGNE